MKVSEFRKLIREEVRKVIKENTLETLRVDPKVIKIKYDEDEGLLDAVEEKYKTVLKKSVPDAGDDGVEIYKIQGIPYFIVDESGFGAIFKDADYAKVLKSIKDGSYFDFDFE